MDEDDGQTREKEILEPKIYFLQTINMSNI